MKNHRYTFTLIVLAAALLLAACGQAAPVVTPTLIPTATVTSTPDACSKENIAVEIQAVHRLMREFDDSAALSANTTREQLKPTIADLQRIRRDAEDQKVPACMQAFKELQLVHMNTFIQTLIVFMGGADQETVNQGIGLSRQLHDQYMIEMARLQGVPISPTLIPVPTVGTPGAVTTSEAEVPTPSVAIVTNPGPASVNLRSTAALDAQNVGVLGVGQSALALGQTANGAWIMIEIPSQPGQTAWVYAALIQLSGPGPLPAMTP
ncbi:MAG: SH3 domain-containing protein [Anaerolineales bacterium]|nr:SH3 domain-containing protein [Anaerolineales bacterium]